MKKELLMAILGMTRGSKAGVVSDPNRFEDPNERELGLLRKTYPESFQTPTPTIVPTPAMAAVEDMRNEAGFGSNIERVAEFERLNKERAKNTKSLSYADVIHNIGKQIR